MHNPFQFGRALTSADLVDRQGEIAAVAAAMGEAERLFVIGPRRYGKTSILIAASERAEAQGVVVLRYNAEAYPTADQLVQALIADAAKQLAGPVERAGATIRRFFGVLRPEVTYNPLDQTYSIGLGTNRPSAAPESALLSQALNGLDRLAADAKRPVAVVIDEFQSVLEQEGRAAEQQIRAAVQEHRHVGYVFAGSKTTLLTEMTSDPDRPFYRLGKRLFVGEIPRDDFAPFLMRGFTGAGFKVSEKAVTEILDRAEDVPYNIQRLAHECWDDLRLGGRKKLDPEGVRAVLRRIVAEDDPFYTQTWSSLTAVQQKTLTALVTLGGQGLYGREVLQRLKLAQSSLQTALVALVRQGIAREEEAQGSLRYRLEDPFLGEWIRQYVPAP